MSLWVSQRRYRRAQRKRQRMLYAGIHPADYPSDWRISWGLDLWRLRNWRQPYRPGEQIWWRGNDILGEDNKYPRRI